MTGESKDELPDWDDPVWSYISQANLNWKLWDGEDIFSRYNGIAVTSVEIPIQSKN